MDLLLVILYSAFKLYKYVRAKRLRVREEQLRLLHVEEERLRVEEEWRCQVFLAIKTVDHKDKTHDISYLLEEPCRKPEYTLDFCCKVLSGRSPLISSLCRKCTICVRKLHAAGASVHYPKGAFKMTPLATAIHAEQQEARYVDAHSAAEWRELIAELVRLGANDNDGYLHNNVSGLVFATRLKRLATVQLLLDYGVGLPTCDDDGRNPMLSMISYDCQQELNVCLDHAEKYNVNINLDVIFEVVSRSYNKDTHCDRIKYISCGVQTILLRGYLPNINSVHAQTFFCKALEKNTVESDKVVSIMLDQSPIMLQACRNLLDMDTIDPKYEHQLENVPSLQSLCKGVIIGTMGQPYVGKVKYLPLPLSIRESLELKHHLN